MFHPVARCAPDNVRQGHRKIAKTIDAAASIVEHFADVPRRNTCVTSMHVCTHARAGSSATASSPRDIYKREYRHVIGGTGVRAAVRFPVLLNPGQEYRRTSPDARYSSVRRFFW